MSEDPQRVTVTDIDISFVSMIWLLVKFAFAVIPALIIIYIVIGLLTLLFGGFIDGVFMHRIH